MIEIRCAISLVRDISTPIGEGDPDDGTTRTRELKQAEFTLQTFGAPRGCDSIEELLRTAGRMCRLVIED